MKKKNVLKLPYLNFGYVDVFYIETAIISVAIWTAKLKRI